MRRLIINTSLHQGIVPDQLNISRITPVPKLFPPKHVESDVRPIAVTNAIAKVAEKFVSRYFNDFYYDYTDINQLGCIHGRSTTHALLKVMHELLIAANCSQNIIRVLFVDFSKAFDVIDQNFTLCKGLCTTFKLLGVFVGSDLSWDYHVRRYVYIKKSRKANVLY